MTGKRITDSQVKLYMNQRMLGKTQKLAAAKAGFSERSARNIRRPKKPRNWRTRKDPLAEVWETDLVPLLLKDPQIKPITLLEFLQNRYPGRYPDSILRTLQRRVSQWQAVHGPEKEIIFRQKLEPGWQGISDFTDMKSLKVSIQGGLLDHRLYHFRLPYSGGESAKVVLGGESFTALAEGLQDALWEFGGAPRTHRSDSLSAAFRNQASSDDLTQDYEQFCAHYGMEATRNNRGVAHENGAIESSHAHLKRRIDQALRVRGSRDFASLEVYQEFIRGLVQTYNRKRRSKIEEEKSFLNPLPESKARDYSVERVRVTSSSTFALRSVLYSVPSRLIGSFLKIHLYDDRLEAFAGSDQVLCCPRLYRNKDRVRWINYRHFTSSLLKKPQAFRRFVFREELFPKPLFRQAWEKLDQELDERSACREYVKILAKAADDESRVERYLERCFQKGKRPCSADLRERGIALPSLKDLTPDLICYDDLIGGQK